MPALGGPIINSNFSSYWKLIILPKQTVQIKFESQTAELKATHAHTQVRFNSQPKPSKFEAPRVPWVFLSWLLLSCSIESEPIIRQFLFNDSARRNSPGQYRQFCEDPVRRMDSGRWSLRKGSQRVASIRNGFLTVVACRSGLRRWANLGPLNFGGDDFYCRR